MAIWLGDLQERTLCGMYVGVLACSWGHLREEAESCRVHVQVRVTIQRRRGEPSRDNKTMRVSVARALVCSSLPLFNVKRAPRGQTANHNSRPGSGHHMGEKE
jgi:hypothetical protein